MVNFFLENLQRERILTLSRKQHKEKSYMIGFLWKRKKKIEPHALA